MRAEGLAAGFIWAGAITVAASLAAAMAFRYQVVEPAAIGLVCDAGGGPWWCGLRAMVIALFSHGALGLASLIAGLLAHLLDWRWLALVALVAGAAGLVLYNADTGAAGFVIGLLHAVRARPRLA
jgi:hypothetical protein